MELTYRNFFEEFASNVVKHPDKVYFADERCSLTFIEVYGTCLQLANALFAKGVKGASKVALRMERSKEAAMLFIACQFIGAFTFLLDDHVGSDEFLAKSGMQIDFSFRITSESGSYLLLGKEGKTLLNFDFDKQSDVILFPNREDIFAPAFTIFTSGSTGDCKGVVLSQFNLLNHFINYEKAGCYQEGDVCLGSLPLTHVFGLTVMLMGAKQGYEIYFPQRVDLDYVAPLFERERITRLDGVPSYALALAEYKRKTGMKTPYLRVGILGGAPSTIEQCHDIEDTLGLTIVPVYGMSECITIAATDMDSPLAKRASSVGRFLPLCKGRIELPNGEEAAQGEAGEVTVKAPSVFLGYYGDKALSEQAIDEKGYLHTGDLGYLDEEGYLHLVGRKKDIIIRNGQNISARKVEEALLKAPGVKEAAVIGRPDGRAGELPVAFYVALEGANQKQIDEYLRQNLFKNEVPVAYHALNAMPLNRAGKIDKEALRKMAAFAVYVGNETF